MHNPSTVSAVVTTHPAADTGTTHRVGVPMMWRGPSRPPEPMLSANQRLHWRSRAARTKTIRHTVAYRAQQLNLGQVGRLTVTLHYRPGDNRRRDPSNLVSTQKPAVDGLVDAGLVPDDTPRYVTERMPIIHPGPGPRELWLEIEVTR